MRVACATIALFGLSLAAMAQTPAPPARAPEQLQMEVELPARM
jgi:hypothetical protein